MDEIKSYVTILQGIATIVAIVVGGFWAVYRYKIFREATSNPQIELEKCMIPYGKNQLLAMTITVRNIGKTVVRAVDSGIKLSIKRMPLGSPCGNIVRWEHGQYLVRNIDVISAANPDEEDDIERYMLEPGDEYHESLTIVVPKKVLLMARLEFRGKEGDHIWLYRVWDV
jgi:hypothetical protein